MERTPVESTNIAAIGYDSQSATLEIEFKNGSIYQYFNVPPIIAEQLLLADSKGSYLNANIKNHFSYTRL